MRDLPTVRPPTDDAFAGGDDFLDAPDVEAIGEMLRERHNLPVGITFAYRWKRKGGKSADKAVLGRCVKLSGATKHFGRVDFLIWLAADHCRDMRLSQDQYVNRIYHELLHAGVEIDEDTLEEKPIVHGHDIEEFRAVVVDYGLWVDEQRAFVEAAQQAPLWPTEDEGGGGVSSITLGTAYGSATLTRTKQGIADPFAASRAD